jgi:hypothetical protein
MNNAVTNSDAGNTILVIAVSYEALAQHAESRLAEQQGMQWTEFDMIMTVDCGLEFGPIAARPAP